MLQRDPMLPKLARLQPNPARASLLLLFDRTGWKRMAFGEFAESIGEPRDVQEEVYGGLEHLDSQCLHSRRWDVTDTKLRLQRKLAVAEFDGICSAHATVMRARAGQGAFGVPALPYDKRPLYEPRRRDFRRLALANHQLDHAQWSAPQCELKPLHLD